MKRVLDLLTKNEIISISKSYDILGNFVMTDFANYTGINILSAIWTKTSSFGKVLIADKNSLSDKYMLPTKPDESRYGILPVIKDAKIYNELCKQYNDADQIEFGEYPCRIGYNNAFAKYLRMGVSDGIIPFTGRSFNGYKEVYFEGEKFILCFNEVDGDIIYKVEPIVWVNIRNKKMFVSKKILLCNIFSKTPYFGDFSKTFMNETLEKMYDEITTKVYNPDLLYTAYDCRRIPISPIKFQFMDSEIINRNLSVRPSDFANYLGVKEFYYKGASFPKNHSSKEVGYLPIVSYDGIKNHCKIIEKRGNYLKVAYGEYPCTQEYIEDEKLNEIIEKNPEIYETGKTYSINANYDNPEKEFKLKRLKEYEINGKKYVRLNYAAWFLVEDLVWLVDLKDNKAICMTIPFGGIDYDLNADIYSSPLDRYINKYFYDEIVPSKNRDLDKINEMVSSDIAIQMLMNKLNLGVENLEIDGENKLVLRV